MILTKGDKFTLDGVVSTVDSLVPPGAATPRGYWFSQAQATSYFHFFYVSQEDVDSHLKKGRMVQGAPSGVIAGDKTCTWHQWEKYVGLVEVYEFCKSCGAKKFKDWKTIKDERDY